jgi:hypothetical protein
VAGGNSVVGAADRAIDCSQNGLEQMFFFEETVMPPSMMAVDIGAMLLVGQIDPLARLSPA